VNHFLGFALLVLAVIVTFKKWQYGKIAERLCLYFEDEAGSSQTLEPRQKNAGSTGKSIGGAGELSSASSSA
jgi:hypothetical protein